MADPIREVPVGTKRKYTTISIPTPLYEAVDRVIDGSDFRSVTEFIVYVTRETLAKGGPGGDRVRPLGHLEAERPDPLAGQGTRSE